MGFPPQLVLHYHPVIRPFIHYMSSLNISLWLVASGGIVLKKFPQGATNASFPRQSTMAPLPFVWNPVEERSKIHLYVCYARACYQIIKSSNLEV